MELADLISGNHIELVLPKAVFGYHQIHTALQLCNDSNRLRSVVISKEYDREVEVLVNTGFSLNTSNLLLTKILR